MAESSHFANVGLALEILKGYIHIVHIRFNFRHPLGVLVYIYTKVYIYTLQIRRHNYTILGFCVLL